MAMAVGGGKGGAKADINVTPLIDVLLVLLIIFMVITPLTPTWFGSVGAPAASSESAAAGSKPGPYGGHHHR